MQYDTRAQAPGFTYKLITATVTPRPIAWVSTLSADGVGNAAPFSFFNAMGSDPPTVVLGLMRDPVRGLKDTCQNILDTGEFVVNLVNVAMAAAMNETCVNAPAGVDEMALAGLETEPSQRVKPPRIKGAPVQFECTLLSAVVTSPNQTIAIGSVAPAQLVSAMAPGSVSNMQTNNYNLQINTSAQTEPIVDDFNMLQSLAGA